MEKMIIALQEAVSHQGEDILRLSDELYAQQKEIAVLKSQIAALKAKLQEGEASNIRPLDQETPPPHY